MMPVFWGPRFWRKIWQGENMKKYQFYGSDREQLRKMIPQTDDYKGIENPCDLYDALLSCWCKETCAPRLRDKWSEMNPTFGQCSVTAFLAQDIFGGQVRGILRPGGNYHCYNEVNGVSFDLTSEQFGEEKLDYADNPEQFREMHFQKAEKKARYELLKAKLKKACEK